MFHNYNQIVNNQLSYTVTCTLPLSYSARTYGTYGS